MKRASWGIPVLGLLAVVSAALAGPEGCSTEGADVCPVPPIKLFQQPPPPSPQQGPLVSGPPPVLFRAELQPPKQCECPTPPPIKLFRVPPPQVLTFSTTPPPITLCRAELQQPERMEIGPPPPITLFHGSFQPVEYGPNRLVPPITLCNQQMPPAACAADH